MKPTRLAILGWLVLLVLTPLARAQAFVPAESQGQGGFVSLMPVAGAEPAPMFLDPAARGMLAQGNVGGRGVTNVGNIQIGFDYIRPSWTSRDFTLAVPSANAGSFPLLGDTGHVDDHFGLAPVVRYKYDIQDIGLSFNGSGTFLSLTGHLDRRISDTTAGQGILTANSSLTIVTANIPEVSARFYADEWLAGHAHSHFAWLDDLVVDLGIGTRYSSIQQSYTGSLTNTVAAGTNISTRYSMQSFKGLGITTSANFSLPVRQNWVVFTNLRASVLVGDNNKDSTLTVTVAGMPGISSTINQSKTEFIPIGEIEMGTQFGFDLGERLRDGLPPPLCTIRVAATAQLWGDVGPLSAGSPQGYGTSHLYLFGAHIMVGFHR